MKAFPSKHQLTPSDIYVETGMDLRDYFAAQVINNLISNNKMPEMIPHICTAAYKWADAMMEARK